MTRQWLSGRCSWVPARPVVVRGALSRWGRACNVRAELLGRGCPGAFGGCCQVAGEQVHPLQKQAGSRGWCLSELNVDCKNNEHQTGLLEDTRTHTGRTVDIRTYSGHITLGLSVYTQGRQAFQENEQSGTEQGTNVPVKDLT